MRGPEYQKLHQPHFRDYRTNIGKKIGDILHLPLPNYERRRKVMGWLLDRNFLFPHIVIKEHESAIAKAERLMRDENYGLIVMFNHWSKRDPEELMKDLGRLNPYFNTVEHSSPAGKHQWGPHVRLVGNYLAVATDPVVTFDTAMRWRRQKPPRLVDKEEAKEEYEAFRKTAADTLALGGIVFVAPQAGRKDHMTEFKGDPIGEIVKRARAQGFDKIAILPIGVGDDNVTKYEVSKYNRGHTYTLTIGECVTVNEVEDNIAKRNIKIEKARAEQPTLRLITFNTAMQERLNNVAPEGYRLAA